MLSMSQKNFDQQLGGGEPEEPEQTQYSHAVAGAGSAALSVGQAKPQVFKAPDAQTDTGDPDADTRGSDGYAIYE